MSDRYSDLIYNTAIACAWGVTFGVFIVVVVGVVLLLEWINEK